jgi:poly(3-hydroxybutyrate) depolymerase
MVSRRAVLATAVAAAGVAALPGTAHAAGLIVPPLRGTRRTLPSGRTYWLSGAGPRLVVGLHGVGLDASNCNATFWQTSAAATTGWQAHADATGYRLALAEAAAEDWNVGGGWAGGGQDDLTYLTQVAADAGGGTEVFTAGFSAGGAMAWRAVCERPAVFAAGGAASGWPSVAATGPVDWWLVAGTADTTVPIRGGPGTRQFAFPPALNFPAQAPRGSRVVVEATAGGHGTAGWMAGRLWQFWTTGR